MHLRAHTPGFMKAVRYIAGGDACITVVTLLAFLTQMSYAQGHDLGDMGLEDLMKIQVSSVSKKDEPMSQAGAAIFVITQNDIRHSGATSIPDLLRMVPGVDVAQIDGNAWAISIRGFNYHYVNKVLVLIDGRTVYTPLFSGVYWDEQDVPLEDIERIEVIRGPGGTVWGANAVNGVINIITKNSRDTQGGLLTAGTGSHRSADGVLQYGGSAGANGSYRVFGRYFQDRTSRPDIGGPGADAWHGSHGGFRSDWALTPSDSLTVQGDLFGSSQGQLITTLIASRLPDYYTLNDRVAVATGNLLGRWKHTFANGSEASVQMYYDRARRSEQGTTGVLNTGDVDFQYHFRAGERHDIVAGGGYRLSDESFEAGYAFGYNTDHRRDKLANVFFQDEVQLSHTVSLSLGSKFEHNSYTGFEYEPSAQLVWTPNKQQTVWGSVARAIRQPAWYDVASWSDLWSVPLPGGALGLYRLEGAPNKTEQLLDFEAGYRGSLSKRVAIDVALFCSHYWNLQTVEPGTPYFTMTPAPPHFVLPWYYANLSRAHNYGAEFSAQWDIYKRWRVHPGYSFLQMKLTPEPGSQDPYLQWFEGISPKHQFQIRSNMDLPHRLEWDVSAFYATELKSGPIPAYARLDTRVGWRAGESLEFSVGAQNLLAPRHLEFPLVDTLHPAYMPRSVFGKVTWRF